MCPSGSPGVASYFLPSERQAVGRLGTFIHKEARRKLATRTETHTHKLIPDKLFPLLALSSGCDHRSISFKYPLQLDVSFASSLEHV